MCRPALANERVQINGAGQVVPKFKTASRDGTSYIDMMPPELMQRMAMLVPGQHSGTTASRRQRHEWRPAVIGMQGQMTPH